MNKTSMKKQGLSLLHPFLSPFRRGNIAMIHIGRCGSTVLTSLLSQHRSIYWASEFYSNVFKAWEQNNDGKEVSGEMPEEAIEMLNGDMRLALHRYYGFEIKPFHFNLIGYSAETYLENLDKLGFSYYIHLDRKNRLRKIVSSLVAHSNKMKYHQGGKAKAKLNKVYVDVDKVAIDFDTKPLLSFLDDYDKQVELVKELLETRNCLYLTYEDDIQNDPLVGYHKICDFIGINPKNVSVNLSRTNPFPIRSMIENIHEVESVLAGTNYEWMLNE